MENKSFEGDSSNSNEILVKSDSSNLNEVQLKMVETYEEKETAIEFCSLETANEENKEEQTQGEKNLATVVESNEIMLIDGGTKMKNEEGESVTSSFDGTAKDGFVISWQDLSYVVESKWYKLTSQKKPILNRLSGSIKSGELTAILGPSGAGKSTFIDCLVGKRQTSGMSGRTEVRFNDLTVEEERRRRKPFKIAIIPQADHLLDTLTVAETLMFASRIKNAHLTFEDEDNEKQVNGRGPARKKFDHVANVQRVIKQLDLSSCAGTRCAKLSGGQYKRVSIGQELLSRPDLMILDEPTSGLDSVTCYQTVSALRHLIDSSPYPMAIVATIHQPDIEVFSLFHKAYVLAAGGRAIFEGPTETIFEQVNLGAELVEARRRRLASTVGPLPTTPEWQALQRQLAARSDNRGNPARLIVEVAANKFGYDITNALNELQMRSPSWYRQDYSSPSSSTSSSSWPPMLQRIGAGDGEMSTESAPFTALTSTSFATGQHLSSQALFQEASLNDGPPKFDYEAHEPRRRRKAELDQLLNLRTANGASGSDRTWHCWWRHLMLHTRRSWVTIVRDPMLFAVQLVLHIAVPLLISYSFQVRRQVDACPRVGPLDVVQETYREGNVLDELNLELRETFENLGYIFFQVYVIIFAAVCVTSLTYPLCMHVLLKEYRNGWYSMSSYFLGRTLADLPVPTFNVLLAMAISYHLTGQPVDQYDWRFWSTGLLTVLATLVAQTMGLMFGAMLMNAPQSAVFVAPASTAPLVVVCGFLLRIKSLPQSLQLLSQLSYFTHLINGVIVSRYGFNRCPCDPADFHLDESHELPQQTRNLIDMWVETFSSDYPEYNATDVINGRGPNLVGKMLDTINRAKTFNYDITDCSQVQPFIMLDYELQDHHLLVCFGALIAMLFAFRWLTYLVLAWKINTSI